MNRRNIFALAASFALVLALVASCKKGDGSDHDHAPTDDKHKPHADHMQGDEHKVVAPHADHAGHKDGDAKATPVGDADHAARNEGGASASVHGGTL
jgi:hypothetical protein